MSNNIDKIDFNKETLEKVLPEFFYQATVTNTKNVYSIRMRSIFTVVNLSYLIECVLKYKLELSKREYPSQGKTGHNLSCLFSKLSKKDRAKIRNIFNQFNQYSTISIDQTLTNLHDIYKFWRYDVLSENQLTNKQINITSMILVFISVVNSCDLSFKFEVENHNTFSWHTYEGRKTFKLQQQQDSDV